MTVVARRRTASQPKPDHAVRCAVLNGSQVSTSPIARIVRLYDEHEHDNATRRGLAMALSVLTCMSVAEVQEQLDLPAS